MSIKFTKNELFYIESQKFTNDTQSLLGVYADIKPASLIGLHYKFNKLKVAEKKTFILHFEQFLSKNGILFMHYPEKDIKKPLNLYFVSLKQKYLNSISKTNLKIRNDYEIGLALGYPKICMLKNFVEHADDIILISILIFFRHENADNDPPNGIYMFGCLKDVKVGKWIKTTIDKYKKYLRKHFPNLSKDGSIVHYINNEIISDIKIN